MQKGTLRAISTKTIKVFCAFLNLGHLMHRYLDRTIIRKKLLLVHHLRLVIIVSVAIVILPLYLRLGNFLNCVKQFDLSH